ncbi:dNA-methyltransferase [Brachyspira sp. CAG:484]|nr:dNA-methyltransferase [Brachyspira sp. CAG:484]
MRYSPLRYPGGKGKIAKFMKQFIKDNFDELPVYVEPYAGGSELALTLLIEGYVSEIWINDKDNGIYCFWYSILNHTEQFIQKIENIKVDIPTWKVQKYIYKNQDEYNILEIGFATFYLNRCNFSGVIKGGPIGGVNQFGKWKIDARFNKGELIKRIRKIAEYNENIKLYNKDTIELLEENEKIFERCLLYLDPPYFNKGNQLYTNHYKYQDHAKIAKCVNGLKGKWIVSYDNTPEIIDLYKFVESNKIREFNIAYSAAEGKNKKGKEIMFFATKSIIPQCKIC